MSDQEELEQKQQPFIKPHQKQTKDYYAEYLQTTEETDSQAPLLVVVQGAKGAGKTTLIKSLVKHYTGQKIKKPIGPITVRSNRQHRVTFVECPSDINAMTDLAKVADLALIMIDASIGFEMETFEFLSLLNNHGFPNVMGVLTHIDFFKDNKQLRTTRKKYKKRFEYETGGNYKLFYLSGLKNDLYLKQDILNLARFISIIRITPVRWKSEHPFILADRFEKDQQDADKSTFYGYVRGCTYRVNDRIHLVGSGDYYIESMEEIADPVELVKKESQTSKHRSLKDSEKMIYAPMTNLGFLNFDSNAGYITIPEQNIVFTDKKKLQQEGYLALDESDNQEANDDDEDAGEELQEGVKMVRDLQNLKEGIDKKLEQVEDIELLDGMLLEDEDIVQNRNKNNVKTANSEQKRELVRLTNRMNVKIENATILPISDTLMATDLHELIYQSKSAVNQFDSSRYIPNILGRDDYRELKSEFVTGFYNADFEDLEGKDSQQEGNDQEMEQEKDKEAKPLNEQQIEEEEQAKKKESDRQRMALVNEMINTNLGLYKRGAYVKIVLKGVERAPKSSYPMILARVDIGEDNLGYIKIKIKKHRWHSNILKSNDPIIVSLGWRRFQTVPVYCVQDQNERLRFTKYTPEYDYCYAILYGNFAPQGSGLICTQSLSNKLSKFRIAATGVVLELNHQFNVVKKLKLIGEPFKIMKNTAFIRGMFNSALEAAKFQGAMIKTVSGLRGHIKKTSKMGPEGSYRATFEDKIQLSDLVFCRTWVRVDIEKFYRLITFDQKDRLLKTNWQLRQENQAMLPVNPDSVYQDIERVPVKYAPLKVPTRLQESLPFESKLKVKGLSMKDRLKKKIEQNLPVKIQMTDKEKEVYSLIQRLNTIKNEKDRKRQERDQFKRKIKVAQEQGSKKYQEMAKKKFKQEKQKEKFRKRAHTEDKDDD